MFAVNIKRKALRNLEKLDKKRKQRIATMIVILKKDPIPFRRADVCKLKILKSKRQKKQSVMERFIAL